MIDCQPETFAHAVWYAMYMQERTYWGQGPMLPPIHLRSKVIIRVDSGLRIVFMTLVFLSPSSGASAHQEELRALLTFQVTTRAQTLKPFAQELFFFVISKSRHSIK